MTSLRLLISTFLLSAAALTCGTSWSTTGTIMGDMYVRGGPSAVKQQPVAGTVVISGPNAQITLHADQFGSFYTTVPEGKYEITASSQRYGACRVPDSPVTLTGNQGALVDVICEKHGASAG